MVKEKLDKAGRSQLHYAARDGDEHEVRRLLQSGADVNLQDNGGYSPLHFAAQELQLGTAEMLLEAGANIEAKDENGNTPLMIAVGSYRGGKDIIAFLRQRGADPYAKNNFGVTPIVDARQTANYDTAKFFDDLPKLGGASRH